MDSFKTSDIGNTAAIKVRVEPKAADGMRVTVFLLPKSQPAAENQLFSHGKTRNPI